MSTDNGITLNPEESGWVRLALLHGMAAVAEIERLAEEFSAHQKERPDLPQSLRPARPDSLTAVLPNMVTALHVATPTSIIGGAA